MIGVMTRSKSCSGTWGNFSTARQPKTSALEKDEGAGGRATASKRVVETASIIAGLAGRGGIAGQGEKDLVEARIAQGEVADLDAATDESFERRGRFRRAAGNHGKPRVVVAALDGGAESRFEKQHRTVELRRVDQRDMKVAGADRRLELAAGSLGDLAAVVDHGDAFGKLV